MNLLSIVISASAVAACALGILYYRCRTIRIMEQLSHILDEGISGTFNEIVYDESRLSQIETKLWRFMTSSKLSRNNIEKERDRIKFLVSDISHQTKTPIANISMYAELLSEQEDLPESIKELSDQIHPQTEKLNFLIQSLIKTSRLESGIVTVNTAPNDISKLVASAISECLPKAEQKQILLTAEVNPVASAVFDPKWTAEALYNLIDNAVKYTPSGGNVAVSAVSYEMFVRIDVSDTGVGIPECEFGKLFERFWRSPAAAGTEGVGIGLYLARKIVAMQGGYIKVKSIPGKGSVFSVFLPKA